MDKKRTQKIDALTPKGTIAESLGVELRTLEENLSSEVKNIVGWIKGKKQSFKPKFTLLIIEDFGNPYEVNNLLKKLS